MIEHLPPPPRRGADHWRRVHLTGDRHHFTTHPLDRGLASLLRGLIGGRHG